MYCSCGIFPFHTQSVAKPQGGKSLSLKSVLPKEGFLILVTVKKLIGMNNKEHALSSAAWLVQELSYARLYRLARPRINQKF